jgi:hypothetical protein
LNSLDTALTIVADRHVGDFDDPYYRFTNSSLETGVKSGFISTKIALPLNLVSMTNIVMTYKVSGTASVIFRAYDSVNVLCGTSAQGTSLTFGTLVVTAFTGTFTAGGWFTVEVECSALPGDTVTIGVLRSDVNTQ